MVVRSRVLGLAGAVAVAGGLLVTLLASGSVDQAHSGFKCLGKTPTIMGTPGADTIVGTEGKDVIAGLTGKDVIDGKGGKGTSSAREQATTRL